MNGSFMCIQSRKTKWACCKDLHESSNASARAFYPRSFIAYFFMKFLKTGNDKGIQLYYVIGSKRRQGTRLSKDVNHLFLKKSENLQKDKRAFITLIFFQDFGQTVNCPPPSLNKDRSGSYYCLFEHFLHGSNIQNHYILSHVCT